MTTTEKNNNSNNNRNDNDSSSSAIVRCGTTTGPIVMKFHRDWSPLGYDRAVELFERGFYDDSHFYRAVPNFLVQFGISYTSDKDLKKFARQTIQDDPQMNPPKLFEEGTISFAGGGPNSRTSQLFIAYKANRHLGTELWETPIGEVIEGMDHARSFYSYGDMPPWGKGPKQGPIHNGPKYIEENFPKIDRFQTCTVERSVLSLNNQGAADAAVSQSHLKGSSGIGEKMPLHNNNDMESSHHAITTHEHFIALLILGIAVALFVVIRQIRNENKSSKST